jgi:(p)ppGpp synthase/HD superfamily hydrolase
MEDLLSKFFSEINNYLLDEEIGMLADVCMRAMSALDKEPLSRTYFSQSIGSAYELSTIRLDANFIAASLLYYPVSSGRLSMHEVTKDFGQKIAQVLQKLIDIGKNYEKILPWISDQKPDDFLPHSKKDHWSEKTLSASATALMAMSQTPEITVVKLANRLHLLKNSNDLFADENLRKFIAQETLDTYSPVAEKLGIWSLKWQMEDEAFKILYPAEYRNIAKALNEGRRSREEILKRASIKLSETMEAAGLQAEIHYRAKHIYGLHLKIEQTGKPLKYVNDNLGLRVIVNTIGECYQALGILFSVWPPVPGIYGDKFYRDWISNPKPNGYQSIHTTVRDVQEKDRLFEVQIRTREMHLNAEYGVAAHWVYKTGEAVQLKNRHQKYLDDIAKFRRMLEGRKS